MRGYLKFVGLGNYESLAVMRGFFYAMKRNCYFRYYSVKWIDIIPITCYCSDKMATGYPAIDIEGLNG